MAMKQTPGIKRKETNMTADSARKANIARTTAATAKKTTPKRPMGELPKRMSGFAQVIAQDYPELGKSGAAALAGKITSEFMAANKAAAAKKAAAKKIK